MSDYDDELVQPPPAADIERKCLDAVAQLEGRWCYGCRAEEPCLCDIQDARTRALLDLAFTEKEGQ